MSLDISLPTSPELLDVRRLFKSSRERVRVEDVNSSIMAVV
jgi:hypothetical protein